MRDRVRFASFLLGDIRYEETIKIFALGIWSRLGLSEHCGYPLSQRKQHELFRIAGSVYVFSIGKQAASGFRRSVTVQSTPLPVFRRFF